MIVNKVALIVVWYGAVPPYFEAWSRSAEHLKGRYDFLIVTDTDFNNHYLPKNVKLVTISMEDLKHRISTLLGVPVNIDRPYRFCDFRPMFGLIFSKELSQYDFWGHTDLDIVWGDIEQIVKDELLSDIDVLLNGGHFSLYRNTESINMLYTQKGSLFPWNTVVSKDAVFAFDEVTGMHAIARSNPVRLKLGGRYGRCRSCSSAAA